MRTSLNKILAIENHLLQNALPGDRLVFEANMIIDPTLKGNVVAQQQTYGLIKAYGRKQLKFELEAVHQKLFNDPVHLSFAQKIRRIFQGR